MSSYPSSSSPIPTRCRSNAVSVQRPLCSPFPSSGLRTPKLTLQIPAARDSTRPSTSLRTIPTPTTKYAPAPSRTAPASLTYTSSTSPSLKRPLSPQEAAASQRNQRAKIVAGILLSRHSQRRGACPWGALRSASASARRYVRTPLRAEVC